MTSPTPDLSVIIPCYNEEERLAPSLDDVLATMKDEPITFEIVAVDDGSDDGTVELINQYAKKYPHQVRLLALGENSGKGVAVRRGILEAKGKRRLFMDADGSVPFREYRKLWELLDNGEDLAIGSRVAPGKSELVTKPTRRWVGWCFRQTLRLIGMKLVDDSQCGFKMYSAYCAEEVFTRVRSRGFGFDLEAIYLTRKLGFRFLEVRVEWHHRIGSKVDLLQDSIRILRDAFLAPIRHGRVRKISR